MWRTAKQLLNRAADAARSGYAWVTLGMLGRSLMQAALVLLLAKTLDAPEYGLVVAVASVTSIFAVFSGLGVTTLHLRDLSTGGVNPDASFAMAMRRNLYSLPPLIVVAGSLAWMLYGHSANTSLLLWLVTGDMLAFAWSDVMQRTMQGRQKFREMAFFMVLVPFARCISAGIFQLGTHRLNVSSWSVICVATGSIPLFVALRQSRTRRNTISDNHARPQHHALEGLGFAVAAGSSRTHADSDKAIVGAFSSLAAAGQYSVAYRFFDILMLPILSFIEWRMSALFKAGATAHGTSAFRANQGLMVTIGCLATGAAVISIPLAGILPEILGKSYVATTSMARLLALLPITASAWWILRTILATTGLQSAGAAIELTAALFNILLTIALVIPWGWKGAVFSTYLTHLTMTLVAVILLIKKSRRRA